MKIWNQYPMLRILLPFLAGIILALHLDPAFHIPWYVLFSAVLVLLILIWFYRKWISFRNRWLYGLVVNLLLILIGYELTLFTDPTAKKDFFGHFDHEDAILFGKISEPTLTKPNSIKVVVGIYLVKDSASTMKTRGKAILYLEKDSLAQVLSYGDHIMLAGGLDEIKPPTNPHQFDYKKYLANKGIYHSSYRPSQDWRLLRRGTANPLYHAAFGLREKFLTIFRQNGISGDEYAVVSALILGFRETLNDELRQKFAGAGAMHVLCVSGLHVGIIFLIISGMLTFMKKGKWLRILRVILILLVIWFYAMLTGFSPSVLRASTMFSFVTIGASMKRYTNIYNTLASSAFLLLLIDPYLITQVGFQLSYAAVIGIVALQPHLYHLVTTRWWLLDKAWAIITVSIAAQLATFPLAAHYFHQFPAFFLLTNLIVIPLAGFIIYGGLLVLIFSFVPAISSLLSAVLTFILKTMNFSVSFIEGLPSSTFNGIIISWPEIILFYVLMLFLLSFFLIPKAGKLQAALGIVALLVLVGIYRDIKTYSRHQFIVYDVPGHSAYDLLEDRKAIAINDSILRSKPGISGFYVDNNRIFSRVKKVISGKHHHAVHHYTYFRLVEFAGKRIAAFPDIPPEKSFLSKFTTDLVILNEGYDYSITRLTEVFEFDSLIFDSSVKWWKLDDFLEECAKLDIPCYSVSHNGAFVMENELR